MRNRSNYGITGPTQTITLSSSGGVYSADDQRIAKNAGTWPSTVVSIDYLIIAGGGGGKGGANGTSQIGGNGGSGVVIIRYIDAYPSATSTTGSPTITVAGGYRVYKFTASGSITF